MASKQNYGATLLMKQLAELSKNPNESFSVGMDGENIFRWNVLVVGPPDSMYEGGFFKSILEFPDDFPNSPPVMTFTSQMFHPNSTSSFIFSIIFEYILSYCLFFGSPFGSFFVQNSDIYVFFL